MYDVIIVGGGPAGLSAALMLGRARRRVIVIDAGKPRNAAARVFHGFLGRDGLNPHDFLSDGRKEVAKYRVELLNDTVVGGEVLSESAEHPFPTAFAVHTEGGRSLKCRKILFATGMCDEVPDLPGFRECYGATVHHCPYCDGWEHQQKHLLAFGKTAEKAVGLGVSLKGWSEKVTVLTNGHSLSDDQKARLSKNHIDYREEAVARLSHHGDKLLGVDFSTGGTLAADALFFNTAFSPQTDVPRALGCTFCEETDDGTHDKQRTNVPGLFLAGDADGDVQFVIVAAGEGATAAVAINRELQEEDRA